MEHSQKLELLQRDFSSSIIDTVGSLVVVLDRQGCIVRFNQACEQSSQYKFEEVREKPFWDLFLSAKEIEQTKKTFQSLINGEQTASKHENYWLAKNGKNRLISWSTTTLLNNNGTVEYVISTGIDITEQRLTQKALRKEEARVKRLVESNIIGIFFWDLSGKIIAANDSFCNIVGYDQQDIALAEVYLNDLTPIEERYLDKATIDRIEVFGSGTPSEKELVRKDGSRVTVLIGETNFDETQSNGVGFVLDLTERKKAEKALLESEERYRGIVETAGEGIWLIDVNNKTTFVNSKMAEMLGYTVKEMLGKSLFDFMAGDEELFTQFILERRYQSINRQEDFRFIHKDGSDLWIILSTSQLFDNQGKYNGLLAMAIDITKRKQAEEKIKEQATLLDNTSDAIFVCNQEREIIFWNKSAERIYGWAVGEIVGKDFYKFLCNEQDINQHIEANNIVTQKGQWNGELKQVTKLGQEIVVESRWTLVFDDKKISQSILVVNTDITEKKKLEEQFLRAQRIESLGILAGGIAHDLNNILSPIILSIEFLRGNIKDEQTRQILGTLETTTMRGAEMVKRILLFARGEEGALTQVQLEGIFTDLKEMIKQAFPKTIELNVSIPKETWLVKGNSTQLYQALMNLCLNARDAMLDSGKLVVAAENVYLDEISASMHLDAKAGKYVVISVKDSGIGISSEVIDKIFEPFFTTKEKDKGTGLGLSTTRSIIKNHDGFIEVSSEIGKGTIFKIYLPALDVKEDTVSSVWVPQTRGKGELILIVDDEISIREVSKLTLEVNGYQAMTASDGVEALDVYISNKDKIKAIILDMMMPYMDGPKTIRALKNLNPDVQIIAISGLGIKANILEDIKSNIKAFLPKPYTQEKILAVLDYILHSDKT